MPPSEQVKMVYNDVFTHGVDDKRRLQVPANWRPAESVEFTLMLWPKDKNGPCLRCLPPEKMAELMHDISVMPNDDPNKVVLKRFIGSKSVQVTLDKAGRLCLPEGMAKQAGVLDKAVLVGLLDVFEIWNPERYEVVQAADEMMSQEAFRMMG